MACGEGLERGDTDVGDFNLPNAFASFAFPAREPKENAVLPRRITKVEDVPGAWWLRVAGNDDRSSALAIRSGCVGHAFGALPKRIIMLLCTDFVASGDRDVDLVSATEIAARLGISRSGPALDAIERTVNRLLASEFWYMPPCSETSHGDQEWKIGVMLDQIAASYGIPGGGYTLPAGARIIEFKIAASDVDFKINPCIRLTQEFADICRRNVVVPGAIIEAAGKSPLTLDIAYFLVQRLQSVRAGTTEIKCHQLMRQLGGTGKCGSEHRELARTFREALGKIKPVWPGLCVDVRDGYIRGEWRKSATLVLRPSSPPPTSILTDADITETDATTIEWCEDYVPGETVQAQETVTTTAPKIDLSWLDAFQLAPEPIQVAAPVDDSKLPRHDWKAALAASDALLWQMDRAGMAAKFLPQSIAERDALIDSACLNWSEPSDEVDAYREWRQRIYAGRHIPLAAPLHDFVDFAESWRFRHGRT